MIMQRGRNVKAYVTLLDGFGAGLPVGGLYSDGMTSYVVYPPTARLMIRVVESWLLTNALKIPTHELSGTEAPVPAAVEEPRMTITRGETSPSVPACKAVTSPAPEKPR